MSVVVSMTSYISKRTPKNIRGMIFAVIGSMSAIGSIFYLQIYNALIILFGWPWLSFATMALLDFVVLIFLLIMISLGKFGMAAPDTMDEDRGADEGAGGYADIPKLEGEGVDQADAEAMDSQRKESMAQESLRKGSIVDDLLNSFKFNGAVAPGDGNGSVSDDGEDHYKVRKDSA
jgi:MFS family permease